MEAIINKWDSIALEVATLVKAKNAAYGDSWNKSGEFLRLLYPNGVTPENYKNMLVLVRIFDKMMRIATDNDAFGEDPFKDVLGYCLLAAADRNKIEK